MIRKLKQFLANHRIYTRKTRLEKAMEQSALYQSETTYSSVMSEFYRAQVEAIDFEQDWFGKAEAKQKLVDSLADQAHYSRLCDEAVAKVEALRG